MDEGALLDEMSAVLKKAGVEIRVERFEQPPQSAGGFCKMRGKDLGLLHSGASRPERARALIEVVEKLGLEALGIKGSDLSAPLLSALNRRGNMPWPHRSEAPSVAKATPEDQDAP